MSEAPRWTEDRLVWVLALALVAGVFAVAAAYAYVTALPVPTPSGPAPTVTLDVTYPSPGTGDATVTVTNVSRAAELSTFRVDLKDVYDGPLFHGIELRAGNLYQNGTQTVTFEDRSDPGRLSVGDRFLLYNLPAGKTYSLVLAYVPEARTAGSVTIIPP